MFSKKNISSFKTLNEVIDEAINDFENLLSKNFSNTNLDEFKAEISIFIKKNEENIIRELNLFFDEFPFEISSQLKVISELLISSFKDSILYIKSQSNVSKIKSELERINKIILEEDLKVPIQNLFKILKTFKELCLRLIRFLEENKKNFTNLFLTSLNGLEEYYGDDLIPINDNVEENTSKEVALLGQNLKAQIRNFIILFKNFLKEFENSIEFLLKYSKKTNLAILDSFSKKLYENYYSLEIYLKHIEEADKKGTISNKDFDELMNSFQRVINSIEILLSPYLPYETA